MSFKRSIDPIREYKDSDMNLYNSTYIGFVTDSSDSKQSGRLTVWIPDISSDKNNVYVVQYCAMFGGATPITNVQDGSKTDAQQSYGWWGIPPDIGNMVVVMFINGDPNRGIWIGCIYQEYMTNMVPNIPESNSTDNNVEPTLEYNKRDSSQIDTDNPLRPPYTPLVTSLRNQGLTDDMVRGPASFKQSSSTEEALSSKQDIMGLLTPGASQIVFDDSEENKHIRFRTANGTQIIINDTIGFIYFITRNGNSWAELSDDGINFYSSNDISFRSQSNINFHSDGNINFNSVGTTNINSNSSIVIQSKTNTNVLTGTTFSINSGNDINMLSDSNFNLKSNVNSISGNSIALSGNTVGINSSGILYLKGSTIQQNNGSGPTANTPATISGIEPTNHTDISNDGKMSSITTKTIVNTLPSHEPWAAHQSTVVQPSLTSVNTSVSTPNEVETSSTSSSNSTFNNTTVTDTTTSTNVTDTNNTTGSNDDWWIPVSGEVNSLFGNRGTISGLHVGSFHPGVDIHNNNGFPIFASRSGTVVYANTDKKPYTGYGNCVVINHGDGYISIYGHMSHMSVNYGDTVEQGQQIGNVGKTGMATGPHLHFEVRQNSVKINPATLISSLGIMGSKVKYGDPKKMS